MNTYNISLLFWIWFCIMLFFFLDRCWKCVCSCFVIYCKTIYILGVPRYMNAEVPTDGRISFHPSPFSFNQETSGYNVLHIAALKL